MQNMNYYYDFSGQKFNHPLSLSINSFDRKVFSRQTSLELSYVLKGSYEVITEHISHSLTEQELAVIAPDEIHILKKLQPESVILTTLILSGFRKICSVPVKICSIQFCVLR